MEIKDFVYLFGDLLDGLPRMTVCVRDAEVVKGWKVL